MTRVCIYIHVRMRCAASPGVLQCDLGQMPAKDQLLNVYHERVLGTVWNVIGPCGVILGLQLSIVRY